MIIWDGLGFFVAVIVFGASLVCNLVFDAAFGPGFYTAHYWPFGVAMFFAALGCWVLSVVLARRGSRIVIDKATGEEFVLHGNHSLFFVPVRWWPLILGGLAVVMCAAEFV